MKNYRWKDPTGLTTVLSVFVIVSIAISLLSCTLVFVHGVAGQYSGDEIELTTAQSFRATIDMLSLVSLVGYILGLVWMWRMNVNAHTFGRRMDHGPIGAVLWFFVPFASLTMPHNVLREVWDVSGGDRKGGRLVSYWWLAIIAGACATIYYAFVDFTPAPSGEVQSLSVATVIVEALNIIGGALFLTLSSQLRRLQTTTHAAMAFSDEVPTRSMVWLQGA